MAHSLRPDEKMALADEDFAMAEKKYAEGEWDVANFLFMRATEATVAVAQ
jgi:hypothetical protein